VVITDPCAMFAGSSVCISPGHSIILMTLVAGATGILVDDATVAVENIHRNRALGNSTCHPGRPARGRAAQTMATRDSVCSFRWLRSKSKHSFTARARGGVRAVVPTSPSLVPMLSRALLRPRTAHAVHPPRGLAQRFNHGRERVLDCCATATGVVLAVTMRHRPFVIVLLVAVGAPAASAQGGGNRLFPTPTWAS
jgi:multidrug efflux pump subunit AcrB